MVIRRVPGNADRKPGGTASRPFRIGQHVPRDARDRVVDAVVDYREFTDTGIQYVDDLKLELGLCFNQRLAVHIRDAVGAVEGGCVIAVAGHAIRVVKKNKAARVKEVGIVLRTVPVDPVMAGTAGVAVLNESPVVGLWNRRVGLVVAGHAITQVLRKYDVRVVVRKSAVADDRVAIGQVYARVNLVDHLLHVHRSAPFFGGCIRIDGVGVVAGHAIVNIKARVAVNT